MFAKATITKKRAFTYSGKKIAFFCRVLKEDLDRE